jgi:hypothetical protein
LRNGETRAGLQGQYYPKAPRGRGVGRLPECGSIDSGIYAELHEDLLSEDIHTFNDELLNRD